MSAATKIVLAVMTLVAADTGAVTVAEAAVANMVVQMIAAQVVRGPRAAVPSQARAVAITALATTTPIKI